MEGRQSGSSHKRSAPISTEIGNKVPAGSVNRFAPDSWPYTGRTVSVRGGMGGQEGGADRSREWQSGVRGGTGVYV